jgi:type IV pilus assembly protein PilA
VFCFKCGTSIPDSSTACPECGAATADAPQPAPPPSAPPSGTPYYNVPAMQPQHGYGPPPTDSKATASLVFGILGLTCFWGFAGIPAVILGHLSKSSIRKSMGQLGGGGMATAGLVMGYISIGLGLVIMPAIIIPNLMRARMETNESAAKSTVRTLNTAQITYSTRFPDAGYARDLSTLGPGPGGVCAGEGTASNACLIDAKLACNGLWCEKSSYNFNVTGSDCRRDSGCTDYVIVATPIGSGGNKRFCSTADAVLRSQSGGAMASAPTVAECQSWPEL